MNLYKVKVNNKTIEFFIVGKSMNDALEKAQKKYEYSIIGIWHIQDDVVDIK